MKNRPLLIADKWWINDKIAVRVPTVGEVLEHGEDKYFNAVYRLYATPYECMGMLDANGIDFENVSEFELFWFAFLSLSDDDAAMLFPGIDPKAFVPQKNPDNDEVVFVSPDGTIRIDRAIAEDIAAVLRRINCVEKCTKKVGNSAVKKYLLEKARRKLKSLQDKPFEPILEDMVLKVVNTAEFAANDFETALKMNIYAFNASVRQVNKFLDWSNTMHGVYSGCVDAKKLNMNKIHWLA